MRGSQWSYRKRLGLKQWVSHQLESAKNFTLIVLTALTMFVLGFFLGLPLIAGLLTGFSIVKLRLKVTQYTSIVLAACFMTGAATFVQYSELLPWYLDVEPSEFRERVREALRKARIKLTPSPVDF